MDAPNQVVGLFPIPAGKAKSRPEAALLHSDRLSGPYLLGCGVYRR